MRDLHRCEKQPRYDDTKDLSFTHHVSHVLVECCAGGPAQMSGQVQLGDVVVQVGILCHDHTRPTGMCAKLDQF